MAVSEQAKKPFAPINKRIRRTSVPNGLPFHSSTGGSRVRIQSKVDQDLWDRVLRKRDAAHPHESCLLKIDTSPFLVTHLHHSVRPFRKSSNMTGARAHDPDGYRSTTACQTQLMLTQETSPRRLAPLRASLRRARGKRITGRRCTCSPDSPRRSW
jgi:hypothetical protein